MKHSAGIPPGAVPSRLYPVVAAPARLLSESPAYRACRRRTAELLADNRRLQFLRALDMITAPLTDWELGFMHGILERARHRRYHYVMTAEERALCDGLQRSYEADVLGKEKTV